MTLPRPTLLLLVASALVASNTSPTFAQTTYNWNDSTTDWTQASAWTPTGPNWLQYDRLNDALAAFGNQATIMNQPSIGSAPVFVGGLTFDNTGADWNLNGSTGTLTLGGAGITVTGGGTTNLLANIHLDRAQTWDVGTGTVNMLGTFSGVTTLSKAGSGTLVIDGPSNSFTGTLTLGAGTLQVGSTTNNARGIAIRNSAIDFGAGTGQLTAAGGGASLSVGQVRGSNAAASIALGTQTINITALADATFSGSVTSGFLNLFGTANQRFNGNTTGMASPVRIFSGATMTVSGTGDATSGVLAGGALGLDGGTFVLDNTAGNTSAVQGRLVDGASITFTGGGTLRLIGNAVDGTTENVGAPSLVSGANTIRVDHNGGAGGTVLGFSGGDSNFRLAQTFATTIDLVGTGGTLGAAGANPRIVFTGTGVPHTGANTGLLSHASGSDQFVGWATVNGTEWAGHGANGIVAVGPTLTSGTAAGIQAATANDLVVFNPSTNQTLTAAVASTTFKITPNGSNQLSAGGNSITTAAIMLAGPNDFTITGSGALFGNRGTPRYAYVTDPGAILRVDMSLAGANQTFTKSGPGTIFLNGTSNQFAFTSNVGINLLQGTLRGTVAALGGGASTDGSFTTINLRGGVLEIDGEGSGAVVSFSRAILDGGGGAGGAINFSTTNQSLQPGDGGFSATNAPGGIHVRLVTSLGGSTAATLQWGSSGPFLTNGRALLFGSPHSDSTITLINDIQLDMGVGAYIAREIRVQRGTGGLNDLAQVAGIVSGTLISDLLKTGTGVLQLTGQNTYQGNTLIQSGTLVVGAGGSLGASGSRTGNVVVGRGSMLAGIGDILPDVNKSVIVNPGGAIRGGSPVTNTLAEHTGTLSIFSNLTIHSTASERGTIQFEFHRITASTVAASKIDIGAPFNLNLTPGAGNQFAIELVDTGVTSPPLAGEQYTVTLASVSVGANIRLNGVNLSDGVIDKSNYVLQSSSFNFDPNYTLAVLSDATQKHLQLTFALAPVPEPASVLALAASALGLGGLIRRR